MAFPFDEVIDRTGTNCAKYDEMNRKYGADKIHLGVADMDFRSPAQILEALRAAVDHGVFGYTVLPENYPRLVSDWMASRYHCPIKPEWVVFSPRINMAANMAVETFTNPGDGILVHSPAYPSLTDAVVKYGRTLVESPLVFRGGRWQMNFEEMERLGKNIKMVIFCNPHNPTGRVWDKEELALLGDFCVRHSLMLLTDDIHADIVRVPGSYTPIINLSKKIAERTILFNSITKTFNVPGVILSNMVISNADLREQMKTTADRWGLHNPNVFAASLLEPAYTQCGDWMRAVNEYLWQNQDYLYAFFKEKMPLFDPGKPEGTYLNWLGFERTGLTPSQLEDLLVNHAKVTVYPGAHFGCRWEKFIRINVATARPRLTEALERIYQAYREYNPFQE